MELSDRKWTPWLPSAGVRFDENVRMTPRSAVHRYRLVAKVPIHRIKQLHGLLVRPDWVDDQREQSEASEEEHKLGQGHVGAHFSPVGEGYPPHVVGEHHPTVEGVDHDPLVGSPKQGACPAGLEERWRNVLSQGSEQKVQAFYLRKKKIPFNPRK